MNPGIRASDASCPAASSSSRILTIRRCRSKRTSFEIFVCSLVAIHTPFGSFVVYLVIGRSLIEVSLLRLMPTVFLFVIVHGIEVSPMSIFQFGGSTSQLQSYPSVRDSAPGYCKESFLYRGI